MPTTFKCTQIFNKIICPDILKFTIMWTDKLQIQKTTVKRPLPKAFEKKTKDKNKCLPFLKNEKTQHLVVFQNFDDFLPLS